MGMGYLAYFSLVALFTCGIQGASLPYQKGYDFHFNEMGVRLDVAMKDINPLVGGKAHVELPISAVWKLLEDEARLVEPIVTAVEKTTLPVWKLVEAEAPFLKPIIIALEKQTVGKLYDVMTVKADLTFNAEKVLEGIFNVAVDYVIVHRDGTEEKATLLIQGKKEAGKLVTSLEIIPKTNVDTSKKIFFPLEMMFTCNWPSAHTLTIKGDFGKIFLNIANDMNEVSIIGVLEYLGQQYKYSYLLSIKDKYITATYQLPTKEIYDIAMEFKMLNGFPRLEITGNVPTSQMLTAGVFKIEVIINNWLDYEIKHIFNNMEMLKWTFSMSNGFPRIEMTGTMPTSKLFKAGTFKTDIIVNDWLDYDMKHIFNGVDMLNLTFKIMNGFPRIDVTGNMATSRFFTAGFFKTEVIVKSWLDYEIKHIFNGKEMLNLTFKMLNGFPRFEMTGTLPTSRLYTAGDFKTEVIVNSWFDYDIKHFFNGKEMLSMTLKEFNGFPRLEFTGIIPTLPIFPAGVFKTEVIVNNWLNYDIKHIFNDIEMLSLTLKEFNGFPKVEITGTMPSVPFLPAGVFKTDVIVNNWLDYEIKHIFNDLEMLTLTFKMLNGFPRILVTGALPSTPLYTAGAFKTEVIIINWQSYEIKHLFNGMEMLSFNAKMMNGLPRIEITGTMPTLPFLPAGVFKTEMIVRDWIDFDIKHTFNNVEMLSLTLEKIKGFPRLEVIGTMPTIPYLPAGVFKTELIVNNRDNYVLKHLFNDVEMLSLTYKRLKGYPRIEVAGTMPTLPLIPAGVFKTEITVKSWVNYEIKHIFNEMEMFNFTFRMQKGYPRIEAYGTMPTLPFIPTGVFTTYIIVKSWVNYKIKHVFNDVEMLDLSFRMMKGYPRIEVTGTLPTLRFLSAGVFKTEVIVNSRVNYVFKHIFNDVEMFSLTCKMLKGYPRIEVTGIMPTLPLLPAGVFKTEVIFKNWLNYEIKHIFNELEILNLKIEIIDGKIEMIGKYGMTHKTHIIMEYEYMRWVKIMLPTTNTWLSKEFGIEMHYQPTNEAKLLEGGNIKIVAMLEKLPIITIGGYYGLILDSSKYEILLKDFHIKLNQEIILFNGFTISELKFYGKMVFNYISMHDMLQNGMLPKLSVETMVHKDEKLIYQYLFTTIESPYKLRVFYPYLFKSILGLPHEHIDITHEHVVLGSKQVATTICNLTTKKLITTVTPTMMAFELFDGEISLVKYVTELTKIEVGRNAMLLEGTKTVQFNAYQPLLLPKILGFNKLKTKFHLEVVDKAAGKVNINVAVIKDTTELLTAVVNNVQAPYMIVLKAPVLALQMKYDYELSTKVGNVIINNKTYTMVKPTVPNEVEVIVFGFPVVKVALRADEVKITTIIPKLPEIEVAFLTNGIKITAIIPDLPEIAAAVTLKTFSLFQNTLGIQILVGKMSHKTLFGWNFNMSKKAFVDVKLIGSGIELLGDYEVFHHLNWNIVGLENIDVEWTGKVLCPGVKLFKTPMVTEGKLLFKNFIVDIKMVEKLMDVPYTLIVKTKPLTVALLPFFHYP